MYNQKELFEKVEGHLKENEIELLKSLVDDVDAYNNLIRISLSEIYIDYDNIGQESEFNPYETFQIRIKGIFDNKNKHHESIVSEITLKDVDNILCALISFEEEKLPIEENFLISLSEDNQKILNKISELQKENKITFKNEEGICSYPLDKFTDQPIDGQLFDINRLPEVIKTQMRRKPTIFDQHWINDLALVELVKYYYNRCQELEEKIKENGSN